MKYETLQIESYHNGRRPGNQRMHHNVYQSAAFASSNETSINQTVNDGLY